MNIFLFSCDFKRLLLWLKYVLQIFHKIWRPRPHDRNSYWSEGPDWLGHNRGGLDPKEIARLLLKYLIQLDVIYDEV